MKCLSLAFFLCAFSCAQAALLPDYDRNCDNLKIDPCPIEQLIQYRTHNSNKVPRNIHRIWFGDQSKLSKENSTSWEEYATQFGYSYRIWTEKDESEFSKFMQPNNYELFKCFISDKNWWAASDILRLEIIKEYGGIYLDCDFMIPMFHGEPIDLFSFIADDDLTLMLEHHGRNIGSNSAIFAANGFLVAPKGHILINHCVDKVYDNVMHWLTKTGSFNTMYVTGPFFINRCMNGSYRVVPVTFLHSLKMVN